MSKVIGFDVDQRSPAYLSGVLQGIIEYGGLTPWMNDRLKDASDILYELGVGNDE